MKVSLAQKESINILVVTGKIDMHNFTVLKAGITKLFRDGKNRIGLDLSAADQLDTDVIREIAILDILAREMNGRIALIIANPEIKQTISSFSRPPVVPIFGSEALLLDFFQKAPKDDAEDISEDSKGLKVQLQTKDQEIASLKARLEQLDPSQMVKAKEEVTLLNAQYKNLLTQVKDLYKERRVPTTPEVAADKVKAMEIEVKDLTDRLRGATKGAP